MDENTGSTPTPPAPPAPPAPTATMAPGPDSGRPGPASDTSKLLAGLSYLTGITAILGLVMDPYKDEKYVRFHSVQAIALWLVLVVSQVLNVIPFLGTLIAFAVWIAWLVLAIIGTIKAFGGDYWEAPGIFGFIKGYVGE